MEWLVHSEYEDNQSAKNLEHPVQHARTKHIDISYHFIREHVANGIIKFKHMPTNEMKADILTKGLDKIQIQKNCGIQSALRTFYIEGESVVEN